MDKTQNCSLSNAVSENCSRFEGPNQSAHPTVNTCGFPCRSIVQPNERLSLAGDESKQLQLSQQDEWEIRARAMCRNSFLLELATVVQLHWHISAVHHSDDEW